VQQQSWTSLGILYSAMILSLALKVLAMAEHKFKMGRLSIFTRKNLGWCPTRHRDPTRSLGDCQR
jgi:hypothetical protein